MITDNNSCMKNLTTIASILILGLNLQACGKKTQDKGPDKVIENLVPVDTSLEDETHKELKIAIENKDEAEVLRLLEFQNQIDLNIILDNGETLLTMSVERDLINVVNKLISNGAYSWKQNSKKESPLMVAVKFGHTNLVKKLANLGVPLEAYDLNKDTALGYAIKKENNEAALFLIDQGANIEHINNEGKSILDLAMDANLQDVVTLIQIRLHQFSTMPRLATVKKIIQLGDIKTLTTLFDEYPALKTSFSEFNYYTFIMQELPHDKALTFFYLFITEGILIENEVDVQTPLVWAIENGKTAFAKLFIDNKVQINRIDTVGKTPLIKAIEKNNLEVVAKLMNNGAKKKYSYTNDKNKKTTVRACKVVNEVKKTLSSEAKKTNTAIKKAMDCTLLDLIF